jgi:hypothetical protein
MKIGLDSYAKLFGPKRHILLPLKEAFWFEHVFLIIREPGFHDRGSQYSALGSDSNVKAAL